MKSPESTGQEAGYAQRGRLLLPTVTAVALADCAILTSAKKRKDMLILESAAVMSALQPADWVAKHTRRGAR